MTFIQADLSMICGSTTKGDALTTSTMRHRAVTVGAVVLSGALALSACTSSSSNKSTVSPSAGGSAAGDVLGSIQPDAKLTAMLPASVKSAGKLTVATDPSYAPNEYFDTDNTT